jgi:hypothetical protein
VVGQQRRHLGGVDQDVVVALVVSAPAAVGGATKVVIWRTHRSGRGIDMREMIAQSSVTRATSGLLRRAWP